MKKMKVDYLATMLFSHLDKPLILSEKLGIRLINSSSKNIQNREYLETKLRYDLDADHNIKCITGKNHKLSDDFNKLFDNYLKSSTNKNHLDLFKLSKTIFDLSIKKADLSDIFSYQDFLLQQNIVVEYMPIYADIITLDNEEMSIPSEDKVSEVANYLNFIDFLLPHDTIPEDYNREFVDTIEKVPFPFLSRLRIVEDDRRNQKYKVLNWISKSFINIYLLQNKNEYIDKIIKNANLNFFKHHKSKIVEIVEYIENIIIDDEEYELFSYITNNLYIAQTCNDHRTAILLFTSIIEALVTHNPNYNRFNVEDSINKQFCLKTCISLEKNDSTIDVNKYYKKCELIYDVRSKIAHGNVKELGAIIKNFDKLYEKKEEFKKSKTDSKLLFETIRNEISMITEKVLWLYLKENKYIKFLKEN